MKNSVTFCLLITLLIFVGWSCKNNPLTKFTNQYHCTVEGEPQPQTSEEYFNRAEKHLEDSNNPNGFDQCALDAMSEGLKLDPQFGPAFAIRGTIYLGRAKEFVSKNDLNAARKDYESALEDLNEAIRWVPDSEDPNRSIYDEHLSFCYKIRSEIYQKSGFLDPDLENALQDLTKAIEFAKTDDDSVSAYRRRGDIYFNEKNDYENAVKDYTEAIKLEPTNKELYSKRSQAYNKLGNQELSKADDLKASQLKDEKDKEIPKTNSGEVLNDKAITLPKPVVPPEARMFKGKGVVKVQVTVDEKGNVIVADASAKNPIWNPFLRLPAEEAAKKAKFKPTLLSGKPVKVTGVLVYEFTT
jgi:Tfp pilus assembly protein PilF